MQKLKRLVSEFGSENGAVSVGHGSELKVAPGHMLGNISAN